MLDAMQIKEIAKKTSESILPSLLSFLEKMLTTILAHMKKAPTKSSIDENMLFDSIKHAKDWNKKMSEEVTDKKINRYCTKVLSFWRIAIKKVSAKPIQTPDKMPHGTKENSDTPAKAKSKRESD